MEEYSELTKELAFVVDIANELYTPQKIRHTPEIDALEIYNKLDRSWNRPNEPKSKIRPPKKLRYNFGYSLQNDLDERVRIKRTNFEDFLLENIDDIDEEDDYELYLKTGMMLEEYDPFNDDGTSAYDTDGEKTKKLLGKYQKKSVFEMIAKMPGDNKFVFWFRKE